MKNAFTFPPNLAIFRKGSRTNMYASRFIIIMFIKFIFVK